MSIGIPIFALILTTIFAMNSVYAEEYEIDYTENFEIDYTIDYARLSTDYFRVGDFLGVKVDAHERVVFDIDSVSVFDERNEKVDYHKGYQMFPRGNLAITQPFPKDMLPGIYNMTFFIGGEKVNVEKFGYGMKVPKLILEGNRNIVPLNDYLFFFGIAQTPRLQDTSYTSSVLVQILDSNGNLLEDNWKKSDNTGKSFNDQAATKSEFRPAINNGATYHIIEQDKILIDNNIPLFLDGYRFQIRIDPITYEAGQVYIVKVSYDGKTVEYPFYVIESSVPIYYNK